jgi:hypothetical protein
MNERSSFSMIDPAKLTDQELEAELANLWMLISE